LFALVAFLGAAIFSTLAIYPFLAVTKRTPANFLVVEGWVQDYAIRAATEEYAAGKYQRVFATGGPVRGRGADRIEFTTAASIGARKLTDAGLSSANVHPVPSQTSERDRTYGSAVALRDWLQAEHLTIRNLNVLTEDVHARRTRLLFQLAFGDSVSVGIIAVPNPDYDSGRWWHYSEGVREVLGETIAYVYAKFFFYPPAFPAAEPHRLVSQRPN
jgi:uncharacterized SAM-binding protein YcdF (DUF218 family)